MGQKRFAIAEVATDHNGRLVATSLGDTGNDWPVANADEMPHAVMLDAIHDRKPLLFSFLPDDQFCEYVSMERLAEATDWGAIAQRELGPA